MNDPWDPLQYEDEIKRSIIMRIKMEEEYETGEVDNVEESDPDVILWRSLHNEAKIQELIAERIVQNRDTRKLNKFKRYYLEAAGPFDRPGLLKYFGMPPEESPVVGLFKSAAALVSSLLTPNQQLKNNNKDA